MSVKRLIYNSRFCGFFGKIQQKRAKTAYYKRILVSFDLIKNDYSAKNQIVAQKDATNQVGLSNGLTLNYIAFTQLNNLGGR